MAKSVYFSFNIRVLTRLNVKFNVLIRLGAPLTTRIIIVIFHFRKHGPKTKDHIYERTHTHDTMCNVTVHAYTYVHHGYKCSRPAEEFITSNAIHTQTPVIL